MPTSHLKPRLLVAASGTGGHIFPAIAVTESLPDWDIEWLGVPDRLEVELVSDLFPLHTVTMGGFQGRPGLGWLKVMGQFASAIIRVRQLLHSGQFDGVLTMGGYIAAPAILAARSLGLPVLLHESNAIPGKVTKWLAPLCTVVAVGIEDAAQRLNATRIETVGNPVRQSFEQPQPLELDLPAGVPLIVVMGGSQGARGLNRLVLEAAPAWLEMGAYVVHLTGQTDAAEVAKRAPQHPHYLHFPFRSDVAALLQRATFAVSRAGAMSLAELAVTTTPAILIPYPYAAEDHQYANAIALERIHAAVVRREAEISAEQLSALGLEWLHHPDRLQAMRHQLGTLAASQASANMAALVRATIAPSKAHSSASSIS
ncbi:MAG: undecaprenyldiphospho-muramoylpentapeptide beta-N-acetylglucosaminyltransferase [Cyanobacteria bacterium P01_D01_bin.123]